MIVLECEESTNKLYAILVTVLGDGGVATTSLGPNGALDLGLTDEQLCSLAGARYEDLFYGRQTVAVNNPQ